MGKGRGITFTIFAALGALAGYATYMAGKDEFSEDTKDKYNSVLNKAKNVGNDIKRTYTSIGDKKEFIENTENLGENAKKLASKAGDLVVSASSDMYSFAKKNIENYIDKFKDDDKTGAYDDLDNSYISKKKKITKKTTAKKNTKKKK